MNATELLRGVSALFDELHDLAPADRATRLAALRAESPEVAAELARWLAQDEQSLGPLDALTERAAAAHTPPADAQGDRSGQRIGAYLLQRRVGRGGMGEVYEAARPGADFEQKVAVKLLRRGLDSEDIVRRFVRERRILAQLEHPGIARLIDGGVSDDGLPYLVMEFVDGSTLIEAANARGLDIDARLELFMQICDAVAYAHRRLIVHRDLKPSNVLLTLEGEPKLLDFGIAKLLDETDEDQLTGTGMRILTPNYAAPEQILGQPISTATDVYALGIILYELLTGRAPHQRHGKDIDRVTHELAQESLIRPSAAVLAAGADTQHQRLSKRLDGDLDTIVLHALKREPERRYQGAAEFADDIRRHLHGHPVRAQTDTMSYRLRKFVGRHRGGVTAAALAAVAVLAGLGVALWQAGVARTQAARAEAELRRAESIKEFSLSLFREQDPLARGKPEPRSASELIATGIERARAQFSDDAAQRSQLLNDLGEIQVSLGEFQAAVPVLEEALAIRVASFGADSAQAAEVESNLAVVKQRLGDVVGGVALSERSARNLSATLGAEAPSTLKARGRLVMGLQISERPDQALALARELLPIYERVYGTDALETLTLLADLANLLEQRDALADAEATARALIQRIERLYGNEHLMLVRPLGLLGDLLRRKQTYPQSDVVYLRSIAIARKFGNGPMVAKLLLRRGDLLRRMQRQDEAEAHFAEAFELLPDGSPERASIEMMRAALARARGDLAGAAAGFLRSYEMFRAAAGKDSIYAWNSALQYALTERLAGHGARAEPMLLEAVATMRRVAGHDSYEVMLANMSLAEWRAEQGRHGEAQPLFDEAIAIGNVIYEAGRHPDVFGGRLARAASRLALADPGAKEAARADVEAVLAAGTAETPLAEDLRVEAERLLSLIGP